MQKAMNAAEQLVFVIDDEQAICQVLTLTLVRRGFRVETFPTAKAALAALDHEAPALIFLDMALSQSDAIDVLNGLGHRGYRGTVYLMSGGRFELLEAVHRLGARQGIKLANPLQKPFRASDILAALDTHISTAQPG